MELIVGLTSLVTICRRSTMRKSFLLFVVFVFMSACVSLTREGQMVDIVSNRSDVKGCDFKSLVRSYSAWGGWAASGTGRRNVIIDLKIKLQSWVAMYCLFNT